MFWPFNRNHIYLVAFKTANSVGNSHLTLNCAWNKDSLDIVEDTLKKKLGVEELVVTFFTKIKG